ncbi:MAG: Bug family tripartite tricarboxylate transporter substrate binding protein [Lautropia sp.]
MKSLSSALALQLRRMASCVLVACIAFAGSVMAQDAYPTKSIRAIIPFGPGSSTDIIGRIVAEDLGKKLGQAVVVENKPGANGFIAAEMAAKAPADGYTVFITATTTHSTNPYLFKKLPYDPLKDFAPVGGLMKGYYTIIVNNDIPVKTLSELIAYLKANENTTSYGWGATVSQLSAAYFLKRIGATSNGVPYKSSPQAMTDLTGGRLTFMVQDLTSSLAQIKSERFRALAVTLPHRVPDLPDVPTMAEAGMPGFKAETWIGMYVPSGTPAPVIERLSSALREVVSKPEIAQKFTTCCSASVFPSTAQEFADYVAEDRAGWAEHIKSAGIQPE